MNDANVIDVRDTQHGHFLILDVPPKALNRSAHWLASGLRLGAR